MTQTVQKTVIYTVLIIWAFVCLFPIYWTASTAFKEAKDIYNQFGGALGGPVLRNKAFFFGAYQGRLENQTPPTANPLGCRTPAIPWAAVTPRWASPACNGGRQVDRRASVREQPRRGLAVSARVALNFLAATCRPRPIRAAGCSTASRTTTPSTGAGPSRLHNQPAATLFARYFFAGTRTRPPDGKNVLTLSRPARTTGRTRSNSATTGSCRPRPSTRCT